MAERQRAQVIMRPGHLGNRFRRPLAVPPTPNHMEEPDDHDHDRRAKDREAASHIQDYGRAA